MASELTQRRFELKTWQTTGSSSLALAGNYVRDGGKYREMAQQAETVALVFVSFKGWTRSGSDIASELATKPLIAILTLGIFTQFAELPGGALIKMAFVDGATGEILWEPDWDISHAPPGLLAEGTYGISRRSVYPLHEVTGHGDNR